MNNKLLLLINLSLLTMFSLGCYSQKTNNLGVIITIGDYLKKSEDLMVNSKTELFYKEHVEIKEKIISNEVEVFLVMYDGNEGYVNANYIVELHRVSDIEMQNSEKITLSRKTPYYLEPHSKVFGNLNASEEVKIVGVYFDYVIIELKGHKVYLGEDVINKKLLKKLTIKFRDKSCKYETNEIDEFDGRRKIITENYKLGNEISFYSGLGVQIKKIGNTKYLRVRFFADLGCTSSYKNNISSVKFKLENNEIVTFYHKGDIDCGSFDLLGKLTSSDVYKLKNSPIKTVRLTGTESYFDVKSLIWNTFFIDMLKCIK